MSVDLVENKKSVYKILEYLSLPSFHVVDPSVENSL